MDEPSIDKKLDLIVFMLSLLLSFEITHGFLQAVGVF